MDERRHPPRRDGEFTIIAVRFVGILFAAAHTATFYGGFPDGSERYAWLLVAVYGVASVVLAGWWLRIRQQVDPRRQHVHGIVSLAIDMAFVLGFVWMYSFDVDTAIFVVMYIVAIEAAFRYRMRGAIIVMSLLTVGYAAREIWAAHQFDYELLPQSITFRLGVGFLIAAVAGGMAERAHAEHQRLITALAGERQAAEALRSLDELRSTFLAAVSHELRTPLTSILGFSLTIRDQASELEPRTRFMLDQVISESQQLERLLQDLLDIERMGRGSVALVRTETDVGLVAAQIARRLQARKGRRIEIDSGGARGVVDAPKVERILENLLGNAIKYSPEDAPIIVRLERRGSGIHLVVDDHGPGVPEALRASIFAPFERGALTSSHQPGTGIGLSIVDRFARLHGGRAWVEDRTGHERGASFHVFLPDGPPGLTSATVAREPWGQSNGAAPA